MKYNFLWLILPYLFFMSGCSKDDTNNSLTAEDGNPDISLQSDVSSAYFGDSLSFTAEVSDDVPLSILNATLSFGDESVSETTIRTAAAGEYTGTLFVPFYANIPNGTATLTLMLRDTHMTTVTKSFDVKISRPDYPYLILVTNSGSYSMERVGLYEYAATEAFPSSDVPAYIKTPVVTPNGNEITFGWEGGSIIEGSTSQIPFASSEGGKFAITFNTLTYEAAPFFEILLNDQKMTMIDKDNYSIDIDLTKGQTITVDGVDISDWWIDPDFLTKESDSELTFLPIDGKYRITANLKFSYFKVEAMLGSDLATLQDDGTGAIWVIGQDVGKPTVADNDVDWNTGSALCMAPIGDKKYQLTLVGGETVNTDAINFKFFYQKDWGGEFDSPALTTTSDLIFIGNGKDANGIDDEGNDVIPDNGNLALIDGKTLEDGVTYVFVVDVSAGNDKAVLTVTKK